MSKDQFIRLADLAFSPTARHIQTRKGSPRDAYLGTVSAEGQPFVQHRGGPEGLLKILSETSIGFVDYKGNQR